MPRTHVGSVAHAGCAGHPLTPARSRGGAATYIWTQFAAKPSRAVSSITNKKRQYKIGSITNGDVEIRYVKTNENIADFFTKFQPVATFRIHRDILMGICPVKRA